MSIFNCGEKVCCDILVSQINIVIPAGESIVLDQLPLTEYDAIQWNLLITDPSQNKRKFQTIFATHETGTTPYHNIVARTGSSIVNFNYQIDVQIDLNSFKLVLTNNSAMDYTSQITRIPVETYIPE